MMPILSFESIFRSFERDIARPLGMRDFGIDDGAWRYSPRSWHPAYVFRMSTRDLARFGLLMLHEGEWDGHQLVPASWIEEITRRHSAATRPDGTAMPGVGYGMMWWTRSAASAKEVYGELGHGVFEADGTGMQILVVAPERHLVFVHRVDTDVPAAEFRSVNAEQAGRILKVLLGSR